MNKIRLSIASEIQEIKSILEMIPKENVIDRMSFESRLANVQKELDELPPEQHVEKAQLTFRGRPVTGRHGISAEFGSKAMGLFADVFAAFASGLGTELQSMGPIPDKDKNQLLITNIAQGSFGFEFELPRDPRTNLDDADPSLEVLTKIQSLFQSAVSGSDDQVAELVEEIPSRAVKKVAEFLNYLSGQQAFCALGIEDQIFRYKNLEELKTASERLKQDNILESTREHHGIFEGVLPTNREFEFKILDKNEQNTIVKGRIGNQVKDPNALKSEWLDKPVKASFEVIQVGQGRPRYRLLDLGDIKLS